MRIAVTVLIGATMLAPAPPGAFTFGALRRDGVVIPFATYDGKRWRSDWPAPQEHVDVPIDVRNVPSRWWGPMGPLDTWQLWLPAGEPRIVHVRQPDWFKAECQRQVGLRTDYAPAERPPRDAEAQPYPKDGLAVSPPRPIERIEILTPAPTRPFLLPGEVMASFERAEDRLYEFRDARLRRLVPVRTEAIYAVGDTNTQRTYFFELSKEHTEYGECAPLSFGRGWFAAERGSPMRELRFEMVRSDCERLDVHYMLPLGAIRASGHLYWIAQFSGWDYERFAIMDVGAKDVRSTLSVAGGGCPE